MASVGRKDVGRAAAELAVIVLGVLVALAVDRWIGDIDSRELEDTYITQLTDNLRADSVALAAQIATAEQRTEWAAEVLAAVQGQLPVEDDAGVFLYRLDRMPIWTPFDATREAWDDVVSTGNLRLLRDGEVRQALSAYYNAVERQEKLNADMDGQLTTIEIEMWEVLEPDRRLAIVESTERPVASMAEVSVALDRIRGDRTLHTRIVQAQLMHGVIARSYRTLLGRLTAVLTVLEAPRT